VPSPLPPLPSLKSAPGEGKLSVAIFTMKALLREGKLSVVTFTMKALPGEGKLFVIIFTINFQPKLPTESFPSPGALYSEGRGGRGEGLMNYNDPAFLSLFSQ